VADDEVTVVRVIWGKGLTVRVSSVVLVELPDVPLTVIAYIPPGVRLVVLIVRMSWKLG